MTICGHMAGYAHRIRPTGIIPFRQVPRHTGVPAAGLLATPAEARAMRPPAGSTGGRPLYRRAIEFVKLHAKPLLARLATGKPAARTAQPPQAGQQQRVLLECSLAGLGKGPDRATISGETLRKQDMATIQALRNVATALRGIQLSARMPPAGLSAQQAATLSRLSIGANCLLGMPAGGIAWTEWATTGSSQVAAFSTRVGDSPGAWDQAAKQVRAALGQAAHLRQALQQLLTPGAAAPA